MRIWYLFLFVFVVLLYSNLVNADPIVKKDDRVWLIGDSNGFLLMQELPKLAKIDSIKFGGNPVPGSSVIQYTKLNNELSVMRRFRPTVVLVCLGTNDAYMGPRIIKNEPPFLNDLLRKLNKNNRRIIWIGPPKLVKAVVGLEHFYQMVSPLVTYIDSRQIDIDMWDDKIHPSFNGRKKWANWIWENLTK